MTPGSDWEGFALHCKIRHELNVPPLVGTQIAITLIRTQIAIYLASFQSSLRQTDENMVRVWSVLLKKQVVAGIHIVGNATADPPEEMDAITYNFETILIEHRSKHRIRCTIYEAPIYYLQHRLEIIRRQRSRR